MPTFVFAFLSPFFNVLNGYFYGLKLRVPFTGNVKQKTSLFSVQGKINKSQQFQGFCPFVSSHVSGTQSKCLFMLNSVNFLAAPNV